VRFAAERGLAGLMIWELRGDYLPDGSHPLLSALKEAYRAQHGALPGDVRIGPHLSPSVQDPGTASK
jgi:GH18 family chitinase